MPNRHGKAIAMQKEKVIALFRRFENAFIEARREEGIAGENSTHLTYAAVAGMDEAIMLELAHELESDIPELAHFGVRLNEQSVSAIERGLLSDSTDDFVVLRFNYTFVLAYPEKACRWMNAILSNVEAVPEEMLGLISNPLKNTLLISYNDSEKVMKWAEKIDGFWSGSDADSSALCLLDASDIDYSCTRPDIVEQRLLSADEISPDHQFFQIINIINQQAN